MVAGMNTFIWLKRFTKTTGQPALLVAGLAICLGFTGCIGAPKPPRQFPAYARANEKSVDSGIAGRYQDTGDGFSRDGQYLGQCSLTSVLQMGSSGPATNEDVVVVIGPAKGQLEIQTWHEHQLQSVNTRTYNTAVTSSGCRANFFNHDGFVLLPLTMNTEAGGLIVPLLFENTDLINYLRKGKDGSLIVYDNNCDAGYTFFVPFHHDRSKWYRFKPAPSPPAATNGRPIKSSV